MFQLSAIIEIADCALNYDKRSQCREMERWKAEFFQLLRRPQALLLDSRYFPVLGVVLLLVDAVATAGIIWRVPCKLHHVHWHHVFWSAVGWRDCRKCAVCERACLALCRHGD